MNKHVPIVQEEPRKALLEAFFDLGVEHKVRGGRCEELGDREEELVVPLPIRIW